ncbi:amidohydrolase family protein [Flavobacteriales bacterium]|jgi:imidazolonepropionase-like amidohydrolase|nr:amidohydrolase family protein [Flavobacteriales bacterium]
MKTIRIVALLFITQSVLAQETFPVNGVSNNFEPIYAFTNAHIVLNPTTEIPNGTFLIKGDKIIAVDSSLNIPKGAIIKDLAGDYIYPSFIDLYSDYGLKEVKKEKYNYRPQYDSKKAGAYHWNEAIHPEINASTEWSKYNSEAKAYLENGFGAVLSHAKDGIARGTATFVALSEKTDNENILIKDAAAFYSFKKGVSRQKNPSSLMGSIALLRQTYFDAEWYELQNSQTNLSYNSFINQQELPQFFAINDVLDYNRVYKIAEEFEIDYILKGNGKEFLRIEEIANTEFPIIIPINFPSSYDVSNHETTEWISLQNLKAWESAPYNPAILAKNGIEFCITAADLKDSKSFLKNLRLAITKGLKKGDALASLTTKPATLIEINDKVGTLASGKLANFFIASKDIFENGIIYENWTLGEKHVINKKQEIDVRGYYTFIANEFENKLVAIEGINAKPKLTLFHLDSIALTTSLSGNNITFSNTNGTFRASGKYNNGKIIGNYQDSLGDYHLFKMQRDSLFESKEDLFELVIDNNTPSVWFPNKAHGFADTPQQKNVLFKNATVWTNEEIGILQNTDVAISTGKIIAIGTLLNPNDYFSEEEYQTIDASNYNLTCGIIDEHSHIAISRGVNEGSQTVTAEVSIADVINPNDHNIYRQLAGGTVASQLLHGSANPIGGQAAMVKLRWGANAEEMKIAGADGFIKFALGENVKQSNWGNFERIRFPQTRMGVEQVFYDAFYRAKAYQKKWEDYNNLSQKEKRNTTPPREDIELNTLAEILNSERFVTCHSYIQSEINMLMHIADSMGFTVNTFTHILEGYKVADKMQEHAAGGSTFSDWWAYKFEVNDAIPYNATLLNNAGVITAINSDDAEMGRRLNQEAAKAVKYGGTSEEDAWKMVTLNPAKLLHLDTHMGSIKVGNDADIVLWTDNPLSIYAKVVQTYVDGKLLFDVEVDKELRARDKAERMRIIKLMSEDKNGGKKRKPQPTKEILYHCDTEHEE